MSASLLALFVFTAFFLGYRFYSRYLSERLFDLDKDLGPTPATEINDNIDYVPTKPSVLFGHHFASIAGAAPIVGPAVAVIWGWVPAVIWVLLGTIFMGAAHDLGALVVSMKKRGQSIGQVATDLIGERAKTLILIVILFLVWLVIAVFALVIANLFVSFPSTVLPVNFQILVALFIGYFINRKGKPILVPALMAQAVLLLMIYLGSYFPISLEPWFGENQLMAWIVFLLVYSFFASTLPVWALLQPRDFINSHMLFIGLGGLILGLFIMQPTVVAPAFQADPVGAPSWFPFLFITIACGAISGFHGLVSSGTTSKQIKNWKDARPIGYGGMLGEGTLALMATLAVAAGFASFEAWHVHYGDWENAQGLSSAINAFVHGSTYFLSGLGLPETFSATLISVLIISFAATSLDTATRIQRHVIGELGNSWKIKSLGNRYVASGVAVGSAFLLMLLEQGGRGGLILWPLFGATNQMLAALTLIVICLYLLKKQKPYLPYFIPLIFLVAVTALGLLLNIFSFFKSENYLLASLSGLLLALEVWIISEGLLKIRELQKI